MNEKLPSKEQLLLIVWIIWGALLLALGVFVFLMPQMQQGHVASRADDNFARILGMVAAADALASLIFRHFFLGGFGRGTLQFGTLLGTKRFIAGNIVCFAMAESIGVYGLVLAGTGLPLDLCAYFLFGALALLLWHMPLPGRFQPRS